jgi:hypothetical protein
MTSFSRWYWAYSQSTWAVLNTICEYMQRGKFLFISGFFVQLELVHAVKESCASKEAKLPKSENISLRENKRLRLKIYIAETYSIYTSWVWKIGRNCCSNYFCLSLNVSEQKAIVQVLGFISQNRVSNLHLKALWHPRFFAVRVIFFISYMWMRGRITNQLSACGYRYFHVTQSLKRFGLDGDRIRH